MIQKNARNAPQRLQKAFCFVLEVLFVCSMGTAVSQVLFQPPVASYTKNSNYFHLYDDVRNKKIACFLSKPSTN